ncbi:uncharacterized protein LOC132166459 [Corylus avellana]|uniref:uncharacterized protein LOC132166459 n=1 Tax=Corylus avellana TaxID=13451 RepID=UPI001E2002A7|nr:uncharacterized protein LOC132166459 [Corylus avellana]
MGRSESQHGCKKHGNEMQLPGVCSSCLRERLSQLQSSSYRNTIGGGGGYSCSSSPPYSAVNSSSTYVSPIYRRHHRRASEMMGSISFTLKVGNGLKKSRSIAFITRKEEVAGCGKKKGGFWSKLLWSTGKRNNKDVLMHGRSASMRFE